MELVTQDVSEATITGHQAAAIFAELPVKMCDSLADATRWYFAGGITLTLVYSDGANPTPATWKLAVE